MEFMRSTRLYVMRAFFAGALIMQASFALAGEVLVAVATNFSEVLQTLASAFENETGHKLLITAGSTGKLYAQIQHGAPFEIFLSADQHRPLLLEKSGLGVPATRFTYATGRLVFWSLDANLTVTAESYRHLAIANPDLAPYGFAARQTLQGLGVWEEVQGKIVMGQNIGQTFSMVATGNAEAGLVAKSYALSPRNAQKGYVWDVPLDLYDPIKQDAIMLERAKDNPAAIDFIAFLRSDTAQTITVEYGYGVNTP